MDAWRQTDWRDAGAPCVGSSDLKNERTNEEETGWYKDAVIYELHVKAFMDSAGDGIGDFEGLTSKLDYIKDLGVTAIWLLPFYPSPLKDDGYDTSDYMDVHRLYGRLHDFKTLLREAHERGIRVITELVLNHTSDQHEWFARSRKAAPGSKWRNYYVWSDTANKYQDARIIFKDFESSNWAWDPTAKAYYWHRFYSHQPDLNYDNPEVEKSMLAMVSYWMKMGVDGLRLDAVPYLFEREGTNCENLPETHGFLRKLRSLLDSKFKDRMLLAEANQWPSDAVAYFGSGDECHMAFHFPLMPRMFMAVEMEERFPIIDILQQTPPIPEKSQWAMFLRNHDELTLEMVTDEERDFMYRSYARDKHARVNLGIRRRLAPLLGNDRRKIELMNVLLFTFPGTPVIYYGDEIGMGDNIYLGDRNSVRTPMQWSADMNAGFSRTNPQKLYLPVIIEPQYHYEVVNVENQLNDASSLLLWMKKLIAIRKRFSSLGRGSMEMILPENPRILAFLRTRGDETVLVVANLSKLFQLADLDLSRFEGLVPREVFSGTAFPAVGKTGYRLTFAPYGYYVFTLTKPAGQPAPSASLPIPELAVARRTDQLFEGKAREAMETEILPSFLSKSRWFGGKARTLERVEIQDWVRLEGMDNTLEACHALVVNVRYSQGSPEVYFIPVAYRAQDHEPSPYPQEAVLARLTVQGVPMLIVDAVYDGDFRRAILRQILARRQSRGETGVLRGMPRRRIVDFLHLDGIADLESHVLRSEQSNSSVVYGSKLILKVSRRIEEGIAPEEEVGDALTRRSFGSSPLLLGTLGYERADHDPAAVAVLEEFIPNEGSAWSVFTGEFSKFLEAASSRPDLPPAPELVPTTDPLTLAEEGVPEKASELVGRIFLDKVALLGRRTAEFHLVLLGETENPDFKYEPFTQLYLISLCQSMTAYANRTMAAAKEFHPTDEERPLLDAVLKSQGLVTKSFAALKERKIDAVRTRIHGDYHLGQVLYTGKDFKIIDYEGEPARPLSERRIKRSPFRDVAGMMRSFHYAAYSVLTSTVPPASSAITPRAEEWAELWYRTVSAAFLKAYLATVAGTSIVPKEREALSRLVNAYLLEKAIYELGYEMNNRPAWALIPLKGIFALLGLELK